MTRVCHLLDGSAGWEQRAAVSQLLDRLPAGRFSTSIAAIDPAARAAVGPLERRIELLPVVPAFTAMAAPMVARFTARRRIDLIHAWGLRAALSARAVAGTQHNPGSIMVSLVAPGIGPADRHFDRGSVSPAHQRRFSHPQIARRQGRVDPEHHGEHRKKSSNKYPLVHRAPVKTESHWTDFTIPLPESIGKPTQDHCWRASSVYDFNYGFFYYSEIMIQREFPSKNLLS